MQERVPRALRAHRIAKQVKVRDAIAAAHHAFPVDGDGHNLEDSQPIGNPRHSIGPVVAPAREDAHAVQLAAADEAEAVMLNFESPLRPARDGITIPSADRAV